jgi:hypothetical protein
MSNLTNQIIAAVVALVVTLGIGWLSPSHVPQGVLVDAGQTGQEVLSGVTSGSLSSVLFSHLTNLEVNNTFGVIGTLFMGASGETGNPVQTNVSILPCNTGTSTLFSVQPPSGATSTVTMLSITGLQGATTTDIVVATSTVISPALTTSTATSSLNANILNLAAVSANSQFRSVAGVTVGSGLGYTNPKGIPSSASNLSFDVGPNDYLLGFSTSTAATGSGGRGAAQVSIPKSCTVKIEWQN